MSKASLYFNVDHIGGKRDLADIKQRVGKIPGVLSVSVSRGNSRVAVDFDTTGANRDRIRNELSDLGFSVTEEQFDNHVM